MKLTKEILREIIKEEINKLNEKELSDNEIEKIIKGINSKNKNEKFETLKTFADLVINNKISMAQIKQIRKATS